MRNKLGLGIAVAGLAATVLGAKVMIDNFDKKLEAFKNDNKQLEQMFGKSGK